MKLFPTRLFSVAALGLAAAGFTAGPALAGDSCSSCNCSDKAAKATGNIVEVAQSAGTFNTLIAAAEAAGLVETLTGDGPLTVFAPTDEAFAKLPEGTVESLLLPENKDQLAAILTYHVVAGKVKAKDALKAGEAETVQGGTLTFAVESHGDHDHATVNGVNLVATDIKATNGVVHVVDAVLLPAE
ncbi:MAG: fasciclin domain-containing protein [Planctomycetota bacterium]